MKKPQPEKQKEQPVAGQKKFSLGLNVPQIRSPHIELVHREITEPDVQIIVPLNEADTHTTDGMAGVVTDTTEPTYGDINSTERTKTTEATYGNTHSTVGRTTERTVGTEREIVRSTSIAPDRNYQKVSNLVTKLGIIEGYFKPGKSLELYLKLHELTRGAVVPKRKIRIPRKQLMKAAGIGSDKTIDSILADFKQKGIIAETVYEGQHAGKEYEVFTPEEWPTLATVGSAATVGSPAQKLVYLPTVESTYSSDTINIENTTTSGNPKTLFKDSLNHDDEKTVINAIMKLAEAGKSVTGKDMTAADWKSFAEIVDIVIDETARAAERTSVSTYMPFAAENLRRRIRAQPRLAVKERFYDPGKYDPAVEPIEAEPVEIEPLGERRQEVLEKLRVFATNNGREFVDTFRSIYTDEDWAWLTENLETE